MGSRRAWSPAVGLLSIGVIGTVVLAVLWPEAPEGGDEPTTPRSLAYVVAEHIDLDPTRAGVDWAADNYRRLFPKPKRAVAATTNFAGEGNIVVVGVSPEEPVQDPYCDDGHCADLGDGVTLTWDELAPQEDPGLVVVIAEMDDHSVVLRYSGAEITGDPRDLDLPVPVETLVDIATDPRVAPTTSEDAIEGGRGLDYWLEGDQVI
ncbi:hypothetical protein [Nocardioides sp. SYSU DS0663]|uniref:hypothetical protein n=1 Tax=Nocardioides sp. SYSU DS0663 TaxID=3416445 RepID=UPI003F4C6E02